MENHLGKGPINIRPPDSVAFRVNGASAKSAVWRKNFPNRLVKRSWAKHVDRARERFRVIWFWMSFKTIEDLFWTTFKTELN